MKPKGTDIRKREQKRAAVKSVLFSGLFRILGAALLLFTREHTPGLNSTACCFCWPF